MANRVVETLYRLRDGTTDVLRRISGAYRTNAQTAEESSRRIEAANLRQRSSLSGVLAKVSRLRFAYFAVAGVIFGAARAIAQYTRAASDQENAEARLAVSLRNGAGATEEQLQALKDLAAERQRITRFGDEQTISAQAQLATFRLTSEEIAQLTPRVQDLAEGTRRLGRENVDLEQSAILVGRAVTGNVGALTRYGVVLTDSQRQAIQFGDQSERVAAIMEALDDNFKGLATSLTPFEQASLSTQNALGDLRERFGAFITQSESLQDAIRRIGVVFERFGEQLAANGGTVERFIGGAVASFRVLGNTVAIIYDGIQAGFETMATGVLRGTKELFNGLQALTFGRAREAIREWTEQTDAQIKVLEERTAQRFERMGRSAERFIAAGEDLNAVLFQTAEQQTAANEATREAMDLAQRERQEQERRRQAIERTNQALQQFGIDAEKVETGVSRAARETTASLLRLAEDGETSLSVLSAAAKAATASFDDTELEFFRQALELAGQQGRITANDIDALTGSTEALGDEVEDATRKVDKLGVVWRKVSGDFGDGFESRWIPEIQALGEGLDDATESADGAGESLEDFQKRVGGAGKEAGQASEEVQGLASSSQEAASKVGGIGQFIAELLGQLRSISQGASDAVDEWVSRLPQLQTIEGFFNRLARFSKELTTEFERQAAAADEVIRRFDETGDAMARTGRASVLLTTQMQLLDQTRLDRLQGIVRQAKRETEAYLDSVISRNRQLQDEIARVRGEEEQLAALRDQERRKALEDELLKARMRGQIEIVKELQEQIRLENQLAAEKERQAKDTDRAANQERDRADQLERSADAAEREARARQTQGGVQRIEVTLTTRGGAGSASELSEADLQAIRSRLLPAIMSQLEIESRRV